MTNSKLVRALDRFTESLRGDVETNKKTIADFASKIVENPVHELSWSANLFKIAADMKVAQELLAGLEWMAENREEGLTDEDFAISVFKRVKEDLEKEVVREAQYVPSSTSVTSNLMEAQSTAAKARILESFKWFT